MKQENSTHRRSSARSATTQTKTNNSDREVTLQHLQRTLVELIDLTLQSKQAHWNVVGPNFRAVHLQLDDLVAHLREFSDRCAERIAALGSPAVGAGDAIFRESKLDPFPNTSVGDRRVVELMTDRLVGICARIRECVAAESDPVAADLLTQVLATLEEQLWMFEAQTVRSS